MKLAFRYFCDFIASLFFANIGAQRSGDSALWGAIGGIFFGLFLMNVLRAWRRHMIIMNLQAINKDKVIIEQMQGID